MADRFDLINIGKSVVATQGGAAANVNFDSNTLVIDGVNNRVGVGTATPADALHVIGAGRFGTSDNDFVHVGADGGSIEICRSVGEAFIDLKNTGAEDNDVRLQSVGTTGVFAIFTAGVERMRIDPAGIIIVRGEIFGAAVGGEGGQLSLNNPDDASIGAVLDVAGADVARWFSIRNNSVHQFGQLAGTGGIISAFTAGVEHMRIDAAGRVTTLAQPSIYLDGNNPQNVNFTGGQQLLTSTNYQQRHSRGGISWNATTGTVTVPVTGHYLVTWCGYLNGGSQGRTFILHNGNGLQLCHFGNISETSAIPLIVSMAANDFITVVADPSGFTLPALFMGSVHTYFTAYLLG